MGLDSTSIDSGSADFNGNTAGSIEAWVHTEIYSQSSTQTTIQYTFGFDQGVSYSDTQDFYASIDGDVVYDETFTNNKSGGSYRFYRTNRTYNRPAYGSSWGTHEARAQVSGIYNGPTSNTGTEQVDTKVEDKAGTVLGPPTSLNATWASSSSINYNWNDPISSGIGPAPTSMYIEVNKSSSFVSPFAYYADVGNVNAKNVTGLERATTYYARVKALNSVGWGAWSATEAFSTEATVPDTQGAPSVSAPTSSGFTVSFSTPNNGGSAITSYVTQVSADNFVTSYTYTGSSPRVITGRLPGVKYRARTAAINAIGQGNWSAASAEIQTLGGVKIWTGSAWGEGIVRLWDGSAWKVCIVRKWNGSGWVV